MDTQLLTNLIKKIKTDKKSLTMLATVAVRTQQYELVKELRDIERESFPLTEEQERSMNQAKNVRGPLAMVGFQLSEGDAWLVNETMDQYNKKGLEFTIGDATKLRLERENLYGDGE